MPNLASMKEEYQVSPFLRTESSAVTANSHIHPGSPQQGERRKRRFCDLL